MGQYSHGFRYVLITLSRQRSTGVTIKVGVYNNKKIRLGINNNNKDNNKKNNNKKTKNLRGKMPECRYNTQAFFFALAILPLGVVARAHLTTVIC